MEKLLTWDLRLFFKINGQWINGFLDVVLPWMREPYFWAPLYLFLAVFITYNYKWRGFFWMAFFIITFALTDQGSMFIKDAVDRLRPCRDPLIAQYVRVLVVYCPSSGSFTSSHAANHFGLAMFSFITLRSQIGKCYRLLPDLCRRALSP
jgi:undecaprenyl-diphosphatase